MALPVSKAPEDIADYVLEHLHRHHLVALATTDENGQPRAVCVNLSVDDQANIVWKSAVDTVHSMHIKERPSIGICVFSRTTEEGEFGFYAKARAREVTDSAELTRCLNARFAQRGKPVPPHSEFQSDAPYRIYIAELTEAWINNEEHAKVVVDLDVLKERAAGK